MTASNTEIVQGGAENVTGVIITESAAKQAATLLASTEGGETLRMRLQVQPGGCSGLKYELFWDDRDLDGDKIAAYEGFEFVVDRMSVPYLAGATIDHSEKLETYGFTIENPNAKGSCACGDSFH